MLSVALALALSAAPVAEPQPVQPRGVFVGDAWRYQHGQAAGPWVRDFVLRTLADFVAMPTSVVRWEVGDWVTLGVGAAVPVALSVPIEGWSLDARLQQQIHAVYGGVNCDYSEPDSQFCPSPQVGFHVWTKPTDLAIIGTAIATPLILGVIGALTKDGGPLLETAALATEAVMVVQVFHVAAKFLTGREAPLGSDGSGRYHGPTRITIPAGTPSGHSATMFAIAGVYATYFEPVWVKALLLGTAGLLASLLVVDDSHFASEVIVGSMMGYLTARWVVEHRSSRYRYGEQGLPMRLMGVGPVAVRGQGAAFAATFNF